MSDFEIPPLDEQARAMLDRVKGSEPPPAASEIKARNWARIEERLQGDVARERLESGVQAQEIAAVSPWSRWRVAAYAIGAVAAVYLAVFVRGASLRRDGPGWQHGSGSTGSFSDLSARCVAEPSFSGDPHNCGRCGHDCCGAACTNGVCQVAVVAQGYHPGKAAVDAAYLYWPDGSDSLGRIMKVPKRGGAPIELASGQPHPYAVAVDKNYVYWVTNVDAAPSYGGVFKVPLDGGHVVAVVPEGEALAGDIIVDDSGIYWDDYGAYLPTQHLPGHPDECVTGARVRKVGLDGSNPVTLASPESGVCSPLFMGADAHHLYWPSRFRRTIQRVERDGRALATVATAADPVAVAVDSRNVYWVNWQDGKVESVPLEGGAIVTVATSGDARGPNKGVGASHLAVDEANVYWTREGPPWGSSGAVLVAPVSGLGGEPGSILATSPNPNYVALDTACVYWVDGSDGQLRAVAKP